MVKVQYIYINIIFNTLSVWVKWEKTCLNIGVPSSKAKYNMLSDSV